MATLKTLSKIENIVWECTVGGGEAPERADRKLLEKRFGKPFTDEEWRYAQRQWTNCLMCMENP